MDIKAGIWIILLIIIDILIWLPFFKVYEKQVLENTNIERSEKWGNSKILWGAATSAYQVEGACFKDGKG